MKPFSLNLSGRLVEYTRPVVMGIVNVTDDSFFKGSRVNTDGSLRLRVSEMITEGADIIDLGACSTRPGSEPVDEQTETERLCGAINVIRQLNSVIPISVDTYRAGVAREAIRVGADIINDISGGTLDGAMLETVADLRVPYILMHMRGTPAEMQNHCDYTDVTAEVLSALSHQLYDLALKGVSDIIIDPGFGFSKTLAQNYQLLDHLSDFMMFNRPVLVGLSRKSMLTKLLGLQAEEALNATTAANMLALDRGADILRVHDVKAARQASDIYYATTHPLDI